MLNSLFKTTKISMNAKNSEKDKDQSEHRSSGLRRRAGHRSWNHSERRLVRTHRIQGLRHVDNDPSNDASRSSFLSTEYSFETGSVTTRGSQTPPPSGRCSSLDVTYLPLPQLSLNGQHSAQGDLSVSSSRSSDAGLRDDVETAGYSSDSGSSDGSFSSSDSRGIFSAVTRRSEGDLQPGMHIGSPTGASPGLQRLDQAYGGGLQTHTHVVRVPKSAPNSTRTSPVSSPRAWGSKESQWQWNSVSNTLQQGSSLTSLGLGYEKSTLVDAHPLPRPPASFPPPLQPRRSSVVPPRGSSKPDAGHAVGKWQKGRLLGSGAFGRVYKGIHRETGEFCAIKEVAYVEDDVKSKESAKQLEQEITLLSSLRHPNIVHYKGSEMVDGCLNIYLELVTGGSIYKLCQEFKKLEEPVVRRYTRQILHGLDFLHSRNTVHRDIKGANILVDQEGTVKLADFGMAKQIKRGEDFLSFKGSPNYMAPEVIMHQRTGFEFAIDIWSLGCTVLEMVTGKPPWSEYEGAAVMFKATRAEIPPFPPNLSLEGKSFVKRCLQRNAADRPSAAELLQDPFVQIPNDHPDYMSFGEDRSIRQQNNGSSGLSRGGTHPLLYKRRYSRRKSRQDTGPSRSAPVSPRASQNFMNEFSSFPGLSTPPAGSPSRAGYLTPPAGSPTRTGYFTPPPGSPRGAEFSLSPGGSPRGTGFHRSPAGIPRVAGFDFHTSYEKNSHVTDINVGKQPVSSNRLPSASINDMSYRSDSSWEAINESRQILQEGNSRRNGLSSSTVDEMSYRSAIIYKNRQIPQEGEPRRNGLPSSSVHGMVNRSDLHWDVEYENRRSPRKNTPPRSNGFYRTEDVWSHGEEEQDYSRQTHRTM